MIEKDNFFSSYHKSKALVMMDEREGESSGRVGISTNSNTPFISPSLQNQPLRIRIRPKAPLKQRPILVPCLANTTFTSFKERIENLLSIKSTILNTIRLEIDGFTIAQDSLIGDVIRESDVVDVFWEGDEDAIHSGSQKPIVDLGMNDKGKHVVQESLSSSSSSESDESSSESSSSESSSSDSSSSSSSSSSEEEESGLHTSDQWVPPGQGLGRTHRNNQRKRNKIRRELDAEREERLIETIKRVEKRTLGDAFDEEAVQKELSSPQKGKKRAKNVEMKSKNADSHEIRRILPPSQREESVPSCIRLTRVDCDECQTPWPEEGEEDEEVFEEKEEDDKMEDEDPLYDAFKRQGQEALRKMREEEKRSDEMLNSSRILEGDIESKQISLGLPIAFGKPKGWDGHGVMTKTDQATLSNDEKSAQNTLTRLRQLRDQANMNSTTDLNSIRLAALATIKSKKKASVSPDLSFSLPPGGGMLGLPPLSATEANMLLQTSSLVSSTSLEEQPKTNQCVKPFVALDKVNGDDVPQSLDYGEPEDEEEERKELQRVREKIRLSRTINADIL